jgi:type IV pilus assembly protein PilV
MIAHGSATHAARGHQAGFSMIELLVAIVVLALGLLGFALLQTMSLRFAQSANHRTQATNLAYDLLDQMRANRYQAAWYSGSTGATFTDGQEVSDDCSDGNWARVVGAVTVAQSVDRWKCQVVDTLGPSASANVTYNDGVVQVAVAWGDQRWDTQNPDADTTFTLNSRL